MTASPWDKRIRRAEQLAGEYPASAEALRFYARIAAFQKSVYESLRPDETCSLHSESAARHFTELLNLVVSIGPQTLVQTSRELQRTNRSFQEVAAADENSSLRFLARALMQPYAERLVARTSAAIGGTQSSCPYCGGKPQAAVLRGEGEGAKRSLICCMCLGEWEFRRVLCPGCGEQDKDRLPVYKATDFPHVRVEACDTCHCYIKSIDLTKDGLAVPCVDELATVPLDLWAEEHGYRKVEPNLLGL